MFRLNWTVENINVGSRIPSISRTLTINKALWPSWIKQIAVKMVIKQKRFNPMRSSCGRVITRLQSRIKMPNAVTPPLSKILNIDKGIMQVVIIPRVSQVSFLPFGKTPARMAAIFFRAIMKGNKKAVNNKWLKNRASNTQLPGSKPFS